jgi:hypothetical protein
MLYSLQQKHLPEIKYYMAQHFFETVYLRKPAEWLSEGDVPGTFYGFFDEGQLLGLFYFSNKNSLLFHYSDDRVLRNMDLLRAVRHYKPQFIKGEKHVTDGLYRILCRSFSDIREADVSLMVYEGEHAGNVIPENTAVETMLSQAGFELLGLGSGAGILSGYSPQFFLDVETAFGRQRQSVNDILKRNQQLLEEGSYLIVLKDGSPVAQGLIEEETAETAIVGGIYTVKSYRRQGLGAHVSEALTKTALDRGKTPMLFVEKRNVEARSVYEKLGYVCRADYCVMTVAY